MTDEIKKLLNSQFNKELYSAYLYMDIAAYYEAQNLKGIAHWYFVQTQEERDHALLFFRFMLDNGVELESMAIDKPTYSTASLREPLVAALKHEEFVTKSIYEIYDAAMKEKNYLVMQFLDWFVKEQGEEEKNANDNVKNYDLYGGDPKSLFLLDAEMLKRVYAAPSIMPPQIM